MCLKSIRKHLLLRYQLHRIFTICLLLEALCICVNINKQNTITHFIDASYITDSIYDSHSLSSLTFMRKSLGLVQT